MPFAPLTFVRHTALGPPFSEDGIVGLEILNLGTGARLYASTQFSGEISVWDIASVLTPLGAVDHGRGNAAGQYPDLGLVALPEGIALLGGGGVQGDLRLDLLNADGGFDGRVVLGRIDEWAGDLVHSVTVDLGTAQMVLGAQAGVAGLGWLRFEEGLLVDRGVVIDTETTHAHDARGVATAVLDGQRYLFTAGGVDLGLSSWRITDSGDVQAAEALGVDAGLWIAGPTGLEAVTLAGRVFLVLAAAGSGSLSVIEVQAGGVMRVIDHVLDDRTSRFGGVTALEVVEHAGQFWVIAGGGDDGVSLFRMLPDGRLLAEAHLADDLVMGLTDIGAIAAHSIGDGLDIYVGSSVEAGITQLRFETGVQGVQWAADAAGGLLAGTQDADVLQGGAGDDRLIAGGGDDVVIDGSGRDTLTGGEGADTFVLTMDGVADFVTDFTAHQDRLDLSGWALLRSPQQLEMVQTSDGFRIRYGDEVLTVQSADGAPIDPEELLGEDLIATLRLAPAVFVSADVVPEGGDLIGTAAPETLQADDTGQQVFGLEGNDRLLGGASRDWLFGGAGRDRLDGGAGRNLLEGGLGNDTYVWRSDVDLIRGEVGFSIGGGIDTVEAWRSFTLPEHIEILRLQGEGDLNGYGNAAPEVLVGNPGENILSGGWGEDRIVGKGGDDVIIGGPRPDELVGGGGRDIFVYTDVIDSRAGPEARDFINGFTHGQDRIDLSGVDAKAGTEDVNEAFVFIGRRAFSGAGMSSAGELNYAEYGGNWNIISGDTDGDGDADFQIFVHLTHWMTGTDFIL